MRRRFIAPVVAALLVTGLATAGSIAGSAQTSATTAPKPTFDAKELSFHDAMRQLWEEHVVWTRLFIVSDVAGAPDLRATTARLLANQVDIGNAVEPFYGAAHASNLTSLLKQHILEAATIVNDAKAGDTAGVKRTETAWYANANRIAAFLHQLNPVNWSLAALQSMMRRHLNLTLTEAVDQLKGSYVGSVAEFDLVENEILGMADTLSNGIIAQFPKRF